MGAEDPLSSSIALVRDAAKRLNEITDQAAETVRAVEDYLNEECSLGVEATVQVSSHTEDIEGVGEITGYTLLTYRRVGQRFRIAVVLGDDYSPAEESVTPWSDCKRELKLQTIKALPKLVHAVADEVRKMIAEAEQDVQASSALLAAIRK